MANNGTKVGSAYLEVTPTLASGYARDLNNYLSAADVGPAGQKLGSDLGDGIGGGVSAKAVAIGSIISNVVMQAAQKAAAAVSDVIGGAFSNFATYEQLSGGVEKIFGADAAAQVLADASQAFQTAGMDANAYMETVTGFSSAMIASLGGDTERAAQLANQAIVDMSDNANTFGTDMESIQNAYQGFAKQNYTMLDNLKLGYGGTKSEMERLLADAEKLTGVHYDISSYADVTEAIHAIQVEMNVAGKTAEEAASTIEGSVNAMKGAWQNWLTGLADPNADMSALTEQLVGAIVTAAKNVVPRLGIIVSEVISALPGLMGQIAAELPGIIADTIGAVLGEEAGATALEAINGAVEAIQPLRDAISNVGEMASGAITTIMALAEELLPQMQPLFDVLSAAADVLMTYIVPFVVELVGSGLVVFIESVVGVVMALIAAAGELVSFVTTVPSQIVSFFTTLQASITSVFTSAAETVKGIWNGVVSFFSGIPSQIIGFFSGIGDSISGFFRSIKLPHFTFSGSLNPVDWVSGGLPSIGIEWYARGGIFNAPTVAGIGEAGPEAVVPLSPSGLAPLVDAIDAADRGKVTNVYIDGARVNADEDVEELFYGFMRELSRLGTMGGARVGYAV